MSHESSEATKILVSGMTCQNCVRHVSNAIRSVRGVAAADIDLIAGSARVHWSAGSSRDDEAVVAAVENAGYVATAVAQE